MRRRLSSNLTFALKFLLPCCLMAVWLLSIYNLYANYWSRSHFLQWIAPLLLAFFISESWTSTSLKKVSIDDEFLYISNYLREVRIPFENIDEIVEQRWNGATYPIGISLRQSSEFGDSFRFMPKVRLGHSFQDSSSLIDQLRIMASGS